MSLPNYSHQVRHEILTVVSIEIIVFSIVTLHSLVDLYLHSGGTGYHNLQDNQQREATASSEAVECKDQIV